MIKYENSQIIIIVFFLLFAINLSAQKYNELVDRTQFKNYSDLQSNIIYGVDNNTFRYYLKKSPKEYKLIYTFTYFCKPCIEFMPELDAFKKQYDDKVQFFYITDIYKEYQNKATVKFLQNHDLKEPLFNIVIDKSAQAKKIGKYFNFTKNIISNVNPKDYGYSLLILFDKDNNVLYSSTWYESHVEILEKIRALIK